MKSESMIARHDSLVFRGSKKTKKVMSALHEMKLYKDETSPFVSRAMMTQTSPILQLLRRLCNAELQRGCGEQELLERFRLHHDPSAFEALLRCHGPMVLEVCRNVLNNETDAEDAFQATFLVLASKAKSIRKVTSLASWLHGVAYRTALKAQAELARRHKHERQFPGTNAVASDAPDDMSWREACQIIHDELSKINEQLRAPLVLCYLQGKPQDQAATELGLPKGVLRGRLERGREQLRRRLLRRGLGATAAIVASSWPQAASAALPMPLLAPTIQAAAAIVAGAGATGLVSSRVLALSAVVLKAMVVSKLKALGAALFVIVLIAGAAFLYQLSAAEESNPAPKTGLHDVGIAQDARLSETPAAATLPDTWELDFENGLPNASRGRLVTDGLPPGSKGAAAAARFDRGEDGIFFEVSAPKIWDGLFAIQSDSHLHFTYKMQRADWVNVFVITRSSGERGRHSGNYLFNEPIYPRQPGKWYTVTIPMNKLFRAGSGKGPPPSVRDIPFMVLFSSLGDRGLVIDRIWVTRGGPGSVEIRGIE